MILPILFFYVLLAPARTEPCYENSTNTCQKCACTDSADVGIAALDCTTRNFSCMLANWPPHGASLRASFAGNNFQSLERLPYTNASLDVILSRCQIRTLYPGIFEATVNVQFVDLSHNLLGSEEVTPEKFRGPYEGTHPEPLAIEHLNLGYNRIHSLNKDIFEYLPKLTRLNLEGNDFTVLDAHTQLAISSVPGLLSLSLADNELTELVAGAVESSPNLVRLDLSKNALDFVPHSLENVGKSLKVLILDDNPIIELTSDSFAGLNKLNEISANNLTKLKQVGNGTFAATPNLTKLKLGNNSFLREINADAFPFDSILKELYLNNNSLTTLPSALLDWRQLDIVDLNDNPFDCDCALYNITVALPRDITRDENGPTCLDSRTDQPRQVYFLDGDICSAKLTRKGPRAAYRHMSMQLAGLLVALTLGLMVAIFLGYTRYRRFMQAKSDPFVSQVIYSPLNTRM